MLNIMKFYKPYDGTRELFRVSYNSFPKYLSIVTPDHERFLRTKFVRRKPYIPEVKRLNVIEVAGYTPRILN